MTIVETHYLSDTNKNVSCLEPCLVMQNHDINGVSVVAKKATPRENEAGGGRGGYGGGRGRGRGKYHLSSNSLW